MKRLSFLGFILMLGIAAQAQYNIKQNNNWQFGFHAGLDFNSFNAVPIQSMIDGNGASPNGPNGASAGNEILASASVSDVNGQLLFYTTGDTVWNRNNQPMPNGHYLSPVTANTPCSDDSGVNTFVLAADASQGALIVPVLNNPNQYYVFSLQRKCMADGLSGRLFYSVVDMTLNGGLGDVVVAQRGIQLATSLSEKMIVIPGNNCDIWVMVHGDQTDSFYAFEVTQAGVSTTPVASASGNIIGSFAYSLGDMSVSPDRTKIAIGSIGFYASGGTGMELNDFDPSTGIVSNPVLISSNVIWGMSFSADNTKLYANENTILIDTSYHTETYVVQYDLSQPTPTDIINSRVVLFDGGEGTYAIKDMKLAPDRKIYMPSQVYYGDSNSLDRINFPNLAGTACQFVRGAVLLNANIDSARLTAGLPNLYQLPLKDTVHTTTDSILASGSLALHEPSGFSGYQWNDGTTDSVKVVSDTGTYWVTYSSYCTYHTDTFVVHAPTGVSYVKGQHAATLGLYPSPAKNMVTITLQYMDNIDGTLRIIDAVGRTVAEQDCSSSKQVIDLTNTAAGVYEVVYGDKVLPVRLPQRLVVVK